MLDLRFYYADYVTVSVPEGYVLKKVLFTTNQSNTYISKMTIADGPGSISNNSTDKITTWTADAEKNTNTVKFGATGTTRIATMVVTYEAPAVDEPKPSVPEVLYFVGDVYAYNNELHIHHTSHQRSEFLQSFDQTYRCEQQ